MPAPNCTLVISRAFGLESRGVLLMGVSTGNVRVVGFDRVLLVVAGVCDCVALLVACAVCCWLCIIVNVLVIASDSAFLIILPAKTGKSAIHTVECVLLVDKL